VVSAEVGGALAAAGVRPILLKGPAIAGLLYRDGAPRPYGDTDLLVPPDRRAAAEAALRDIGFAPRLDDADTPGWRQVAHHWRRPGDAADVDLHWTLTGVGAPPDALWSALVDRREPMLVAGFRFDVLDASGRAFHVVLHAAQHGIRHPPSLEDLRRALAVLDDATWLRAADLAAQVDAMPAFAAGARLLEPGRSLAARLSLPSPTTIESQLLASSPPPAAMGFEHLANTAGARARTRMLVRKLVPTRRFMREWSPLARRGVPGLTAAYLGRPLWLLAQAPRGFLAWRRARRAS
jgi:hypothetical protein